MVSGHKVDESSKTRVLSDFLYMYTVQYGLIFGMARFHGALAVRKKQTNLYLELIKTFVGFG